MRVSLYVCTRARVFACVPRAHLRAHVRARVQAAVFARMRVYMRASTRRRPSCACLACLRLHAQILARGCMRICFSLTSFEARTRAAALHGEARPAVRRRGAAAASWRSRSWLRDHVGALSMPWGTKLWPTGAVGPLCDAWMSSTACRSFARARWAAARRRTSARLARLIRVWQA